MGSKLQRAMWGRVENLGHDLDAQVELLQLPLTVLFQQRRVGKSQDGMLGGKDAHYVSVTPDGIMLVDGEARGVALALPAGVRAMHWDGEVGFAETVSGGSPCDLDDFQPWLDAWTAAAIPASPRIIAPLEFLQRFTAAERAAIRAAAAASPELADWIDQARFARENDLGAPTTAAGLDALVAAGLLTAERRAAVLG